MSRLPDDNFNIRLGSFAHCLSLCTVCCLFVSCGLLKSNLCVWLFLPPAEIYFLGDPCQWEKTSSPLNPNEAHFLQTRKMSPHALLYTFLLVYDVGQIAKKSQPMRKADGKWRPFSSFSRNISSLVKVVFYILYRPSFLQRRQSILFDLYNIK